MILYKLLQDFSIYFPFITEEIYGELYGKEKSIHITEIKPLEYNFEKEMINGDKLVEIVSIVRGEKTNNSVSLKTPVKELNINVNSEIETAINESIKDFKATLFIDNLVINKSDTDYEINKIELDLSEVENK